MRERHLRPALAIVACFIYFINCSAQKPVEADFVWQEHDPWRSHVVVSNLGGKTQQHLASDITHGQVIFQVYRTASPAGNEEALIPVPGNYELKKGKLFFWPGNPLREGLRYVAIYKNFQLKSFLVPKRENTQITMFRKAAGVSINK